MPLNEPTSSYPHKSTSRLLKRLNPDHVHGLRNPAAATHRAFQAARSNWLKFIAALIRCARLGQRLTRPRKWRGQLESCEKTAVPHECTRTRSVRESTEAHSGSPRSRLSVRARPAILGPDKPGPWAPLWKAPPGSAIPHAFVGATRTLSDAWDLCLRLESRGVDSLSLASDSKCSKGEKLACLKSW